ncbi:MAG: hypothetical protein ACK5KL_13755 [Dysgonomonas sp.]
MSADLIQFISVFSCLLTIIASLITIYLFLFERRRRKNELNKNSRKRIIIKSIMVITTIALLLITVYILTTPGTTEKIFTQIPPVSDSIKIEIKPPVSQFGQAPKPKNEIRELVNEARKASTKSISQALNKFEQAYNLLPDKQKDTALIETIESYTDFKTQINYYNEFFKSLNY